MNSLYQISPPISCKKPHKKIKVMVVDDHNLVREALINLFSRQPDFEVVAQASDGNEAIEMAYKTIPDIIIMDIAMPKLNGLEATKQIKLKYPQIEVLALSVHSDNEHVFNILQAGAGGFLTKTASDLEIICAIRALAAGDTVLSPEISRQVFRYGYQYYKKPISNITIDRLTAREFETLRLVAKGISNKEIASRLQISVRCIKYYLSNTFQKLNVTSRTEAVATSLQNGILTLDDLD
jgi:DNA-binding NarL/FixJ family response regulator